MEQAGDAGGGDAEGARVEGSGLGEETSTIAEKANDLDKIGSAVADAGGVGAGLWITYLSLLFYIAIAAGAVTHRDLLLENPVKLPFLNVDLPLVAFFVLAPLLFVVVHLYTLLNFNLLADKIQRFEEAIAAQTTDEQVRGRLRRLLPTNVFVQYLARPPTAAPLRPLFWLIVNLTLVVAPILLLVFLQVQFLPYHHYSVVWLQRSALGIDLILLWWLWPGLAPEAAGAAQMRKGWMPPVAFVMVMASVMTIACLPGEWLSPVHDLLFSSTVDMVRGKPAGWFSNSLVLTDVVAVERAKSDKLETNENDVSISLRGRDPNGALFIRSDLRSADFTGASLRNARFDQAVLTRARFGCADRSKDSCTTLESASFAGAHAERASFERANLRSADFDHAALEGSSFYAADLRGSHMDGAQLQGASMLLANFQAGWLSHSFLQGASLISSRLEKAPIFDAYLQGANFSDAKLQGAVLAGSEANSATFASASVWRSDISNAVTDNAQGTDADHIEGPELCPEPICPEDPNAYESMRRSVESELPAGLVRTMVLGMLHGLDPSHKRDDAEHAKVWKEIAARQPSESAYRRALAAELGKIGCDTPDPPYVIEGLIDNGRIADTGPEAVDLVALFADEQRCPGARGLSTREKDKLRAIAEETRRPLKNDGI